MLKRKIEREIEHWIDNSNKALMIYGARQVGKTFIIRSVFDKRKLDYAEFNLIADSRIVEILKTSSTVNDLILKLSLVSEKAITPEQTFIFFDEIQEYPEIVTKIKFLVDDKRFRFVLSGSLLGVEIRNLKSAPVGYLQSLTMYPLDFEEFLQLFNIPEELMTVLQNCFEKRVPVDKIVNDKLIDIFNLYLIIGGMPAAVDAYRRTNNIDDVIIEHNAIIEQYKKDFTKYEADNRKFVLTKIYEMIPSELNEKNKRFTITDIDKSARIDRLSDSFTWLTKAGVAIATYNSTEPKTPLRLNEKSSLFKLFLSDVGLLTTMYGKSTKLQIVNRESDINKGAVFENVIAQELTAHGFTPYYYIGKKYGELDFVIEFNGRILPIEVKSGKDYTRHSALDNIMKIDSYALTDAIVFAPSNVFRQDNITYYPVYMIMFLREQTSENPIIPLSRFTFS